MEMITIKSFDSKLQKKQPTKNEPRKVKSSAVIPFSFLLALPGKRGIHET